MIEYKHFSCLGFIQKKIRLLSYSFRCYNRQPRESYVNPSSWEEVQYIHEKLSEVGVSFKDTVDALTTYFSQQKKILDMKDLYAKSYPTISLYYGQGSVIVFNCLTPHSTLFQLYRGGQFYWRGRPDVPGENLRLVATH